MISKQLSKAYCFLQKMPENVDPTEILEWKISLHKMANESITVLVQKSTEKNLIKEEKGLTLTF